MESIVRTISELPAANAVTSAFSKMLSNGVSIEDIKNIPPAKIGAAALAYVILCSSLRFRRMRRMKKKLNNPDRKALAKMTNVEAQSIIGELYQYEFPLVFLKSLQFALFKTYAIPTISSLLVATRMFSTPASASKRYEDTTVLIGEFLFQDPRKSRTVEAISRMNYLHNPYIKAGKISNEDLLYTLSVFITEPVTWINKFEWRTLTDYEICALGTYWKSIGDAMGIEYKGYLKQEEWKDGLEFYEDIKDWAQHYEAKEMVPTATNKQTADELVPLLLYYIPRPLMPVAREAVGTLMGERLRWAMIYPEPSNIAQAATFAAFSLRRFVLRYLTLPRLVAGPEFSNKDPKTGRYNHNNYLVHPYYVKPTFSNRWGPIAWMTWALGGIVPGGKGGEKYHPEGYRFDEVGPEKRRGVGRKEMDGFEEKIKSVRHMGCPFAVK
ncbi:uncharacterized protein APUU_22167A [Aspergillus puulaauensis]|uniref:ER-bound oxygenase mpaB/mpaB'/Rubber oxygenase catalytic domain-containing protein n=1 Tax=Aspergillus puulaauensis TaxID=1220207 RepID=A0A7R7XI40_9EURO|nr:uncharacterized protein APUU_22167A [Aspergillus puulaauensis]BCS21735.1 hypothetical protein APUU_22167A [Aspergillus puulaauensis]